MTERTTRPRGPLPFEVEPSTGRDHSQRYGSRYWAVGLPDGRQVYMWADRIVVDPSGALVAWEDTKEVSGWNPQMATEREPIDPEITLILAPGSWVHAYAAGAGNAPAVVSCLAPPGRSAGWGQPGT
jgi:hypothetical protein